MGAVHHHTGRFPLACSCSAVCPGRVGASGLCVSASAAVRHPSSPGPPACLLAAGVCCPCSCWGDLALLCKQCHPIPCSLCRGWHSVSASPWSHGLCCCCPAAVLSCRCPPVWPRSKVVRKSIARVHTVYRANIRQALRSKISNDGANKKGRVSGTGRGECGVDDVLHLGVCTVGISVCVVSGSRQGVRVWVGLADLLLVHTAK